MNLKPIRFCNLDNFQSKFSALSRASLLLSGLAASGLYAATISLPIASSGAMITTTDNATTYCSLQGSPVACSYGGATSSASISSGGSAQAFSGTNTSLEASSSTFLWNRCHGSNLDASPYYHHGNVGDQRQREFQRRNRVHIRNRRQSRPYGRCQPVFQQRFRVLPIACRESYLGLYVRRCLQL